IPWHASSLACGAPRNGLAQAGTRREYVHVASSSASMPPTVPSRARPFHDAEPSGWVDASAVSRESAPGVAGKVVRFGEIKEEAGPQPGRGTFAKADRLSSVSAREDRGCSRSYGQRFTRNHAAYSAGRNSSVSTVATVR